MSSRSEADGAPVAADAAFVSGSALDSSASAPSAAGNTPAAAARRVSEERAGSHRAAALEAAGRGGLALRLGRWLPVPRLFRVLAR